MGLVESGLPQAVHDWMCFYAPERAAMVRRVRAAVLMGPGVGCIAAAAEDGNKNEESNDDADDNYDEKKDSFWNLDIIENKILKS